MHILTFLVVGLSSCESWKDAFDREPLPRPRDHANREYVVAELADTNELTGPWKIEEPMPIPNHFVLSLDRSHSKRSLGFPVYSGEPRTLQRRLPMPTLDQIEEVKEKLGINDPLFHQQWHVLNIKQPGNDMHVTDVWLQGVRGRGITVAVVDDGIDYTHPDLEANFSPRGSWDYNMHRNLPTHEHADDGHGTRCAGEIAAAINNHCGVGMAPEAKVSGIRILSGDISPIDEARALNHQLQINDIYSCSWGPSDNGFTVEGAPPIVKRAIVNAVERGRSGKGSIFFFAAGNGHSNGDNCNYDGYTNSIYSITVAATDQFNRHPYYSEMCSANMVSTYSSNHQTRITTTDRRFLQGEDFHECTNKHSGTSAAAPIAAGIMALVLQVRPDLTWRDAQYLVRDAAVPFEIPDGEDESVQWQLTHDGRNYSTAFGYGVLHADRLVAKARTHQLVGPQAWHISGMYKPNVTLVAGTVRSTITVSEQQYTLANLRRLEHVNVRLTVDTDIRGALSYRLVSPNGIVSHLAASRPRDNSGLGLMDWEFMSVMHWNETGTGDWTLEIDCPEEALANSKKTNTLVSWQLRLWGEAENSALATPYSQVYSRYNVDAQLVEPEGEQDPSQTDNMEPTTTETSTTSSRAADSAESAESAESSPSETAAPTETPIPDYTNAHSILYYVLMTVIGGALTAAVMVPIIWYYQRRRSRRHGPTLDSSDFALMASDIELDEFEIEEEEPVQKATAQNGTASAATATVSTAN